MTQTSVTFEIHNYLITAKQHILVAGETGWGKSTVINGLINSILHKDPRMNQLILIDPKKVEFAKYRNVAHCIAFESETSKVEKLLEKCIDGIQRRLDIMVERGEDFYTGSKIYIIIDELADLAFTSKKAMGYIQRIAQIGRAANIQLICATQCPLAEVIPTRIKCNLGLRIAVHTACAQDSRNILGYTGAEALQIGEAIIRNKGIVRMPKVPEEALKTAIAVRTIR